MVGSTVYAFTVQLRSWQLVGLVLLGSSHGARLFRASMEAVGWLRREMQRKEKPGGHKKQIKSSINRV